MGVGGMARVAWVRGGVEAGVEGEDVRRAECQSQPARSLIVTAKRQGGGYLPLPLPLPLALTLTYRSEQLAQLALLVLHLCLHMVRGDN